jgi:hypothetical protein
MVPARYEPTSVLRASAIYIPDATMGILMRQQSRIRQVKEIADGF